MKWLIKIWRKIVRWCFTEDTIEIQSYRLVSVKERLPVDAIKSRIVYHVGDEDWKWLLQFQCPCGCEDVIQLSLLKNSRESWEIAIHDDEKFSIHPSINRTINCGSHFFIRNNSVQFCNEDY